MIKRRDFLKVMGVSGPAALLEACAPPQTEQLIPYLVSPDNIVPGVPAYYTTQCRECPAGCGMLAKTREGRVIKAEGNPNHPVGQGRLCIRGQASVQSLYNPDRFRGPLLRDEGGQLRPTDWEQAEELLNSRLGQIKASGSQQRVAWMGRLLTGSMEQLTRQWLQSLGSERLLFYETFDYEPLRRATQIAFDRSELPSYHLQDARFLISFGADFLETWRSNVELMGDFQRMRKARSTERPDNFVHISQRLSLTASNADWWIPITPGAEVQLALAIIHSILEQGLAVPEVDSDRGWIESLVEPYSPEAIQNDTGVEVSSIQELARRFSQDSPSLALGGGVSSTGEQAVSLELAVLLLNAVAGNLGKTLTFGIPSALDQLATYQEVLDLIQDMNQEKIEVLFLHEANPVFTLPQSCGFAEALEKVPLVVSFSRLPDETTARADLILPDHHFLESWGDFSPRAGVVSIQQPAMQPVFDSKATGDVLLSTAQNIDGMASEFEHSNYFDWLHAYWDSEIRTQVATEQSWEEFWPDVLRQGGHFQEVEPVTVALRNFSTQIRLQPESLEGPEDGHALLVYPSAAFFDGRNANNSWLQEIPDPVTQLVWDGWVEVHPDSGREMGLQEGDVVTVTSPYGSVTLPVHLFAGLKVGVVAMSLGQGRSGELRYTSGRGDNPMRLLSPQAEAESGSLLWRSVRVSLAKTGERHQLVSLQARPQDHPRDTLIAREVQDTPFAEQIFPSQLSDSASGEEHDTASSHHEPIDYYPPHDHPDHQWGMAIDLDSCTGCNACVAACYAENNVPIVGKEKCAQGRVMSWLRIERHLHDPPLTQETDLVQPQVTSVPALCQHCHNAPCEPVCPVFATYHNPEGLNAQVYARCVGTRYCSNNCPYKVRRFNWSASEFPEPLELQLNPDVTVRTSGVMEKCTFCVQRIQAGKNRAGREERQLVDGDITPACAQTCPAEAILFGDLADPNSRLSQRVADPRGYHLLESLNTRPAITYLKKLVPEKPFDEE